MPKPGALPYALSVAACTIPVAAKAQAADPPTAPTQQAVPTEDIIVTAQKRSERLRDVPVSITAETGEQLKAQGISSPADLGKVVPGFSYQASAYGTPVFTIRGIGLYDNFFGVSPTVTVYVDQVPLPYLAMTEGAGLDVERVEVLKGPQGTLFGQNSTGGAINYIAAKPTKDWRGGLDLSYGRFNEVDAEGFVSGPLSDTLSVRLSARHEGRSDWQYSTSRPTDTSGRRDFTAARLLLDWAPVSSVRFELNANTWWDKSDTQALQFTGYLPNSPAYPEAGIALSGRAAAPQNDRASDFDAGANLRRNDRLYQVSLRSDVDITDSGALTSITSYSDFRAFDPSDVDGTDYPDIFATQIGKVQSFNQEVRLEQRLGSRLRLTAGGSYQNDKVYGDVIDHSVGSNSGLGPIRYFDFGQRVDQRVRTLAGFGALDVKLTSKLTLQGSARYTNQKRRFSGCLEDTGDGRLAAGINFIHTIAGLPSSLAAPGTCVTLDASSPTLATLSDVTSSLNEQNVSWRGGLSWKPSGNTLLYVNATKGYKSGSYSALPAVFSNQFTPVTQESVVAYEAGFKTKIASSLQLTGAVFAYQYRDKQILGFVQIDPFGKLPALQNIPRSSVKGAELQATYNLGSAFKLTAGATYVHSKIDGHFATIDAVGSTVDIGGEPFPNTPKWQLLGDAQYRLPISERLTAFIGGDVSYRTSTYAGLGENTEYRIDGYSLVDLRAGVETSGGAYRLQVWGKNVFNKYYWVNTIRAIDTFARTTGMPATYGVTLSARF